MMRKRLHCRGRERRAVSVAALIAIKGQAWSLVVLPRCLDILSASACSVAHSIHRMQGTKPADHCVGWRGHSETHWQRATEMLETCLY